MAEHYTRSTTGLMSWCNRCRRDTWHKVSYGHKGECTSCAAKRDVEIARRKIADAKKPVQGQIDWLPPAA